MGMIWDNRFPPLFCFLVSHLFKIDLIKGTVKEKVVKFGNLYLFLLCHSSCYAPYYTILSCAAPS